MRKQSLYFNSDMVHEIKAEAARLDRSISWVVQQAWRLSREKIQQFPGVPE
jgi:uncharacterized small protein (TIGR04563 family)